MTNLPKSTVLTLLLRRRAVLGLVGCIATLYIASCVSAGTHSAGPNSAGDRKVFEQNLSSRPVLGVIKFYSSSGGKSGYYTLQNTTAQDRKYRLKIVLEDGKSVGRITHAKAWQTSRPATFTAAGSRRTGIRRVELIYARPE